MCSHNNHSNIKNSGEMRRPEEEVRRGPWTCEEDALLTHYVTRNGEGHWNSLAFHAGIFNNSSMHPKITSYYGSNNGLQRTGKSCRLRWLNYLKPDIKRGNFTQQEHLLIFELHSKWGNRWSKIAQHLPGRTDNEIKNYWRTRVQKQVRQLNAHDDQSNTTRQFVDSSSSSSISTKSHSNYSSVHQNLGPPNSSQSISNSPTIPQPVSIHPKGCSNSFKDQNFLAQDSISSFMPDIDEFPKPNNISHFYDFERSSSDYIPIDCFESGSVDYVDMKSVEQFTEFQANFDCQLASGDWSSDSFWKF